MSRLTNSEAWKGVLRVDGFPLFNLQMRGVSTIQRTFKSKRQSVGFASYHFSFLIPNS